MKITINYAELLVAASEYLVRRNFGVPTSLQLFARPSGTVGQSEVWMEAEMPSPAVPPPPAPEPPPAALPEPAPAPVAVKRVDEDPFEAQPVVGPTVENPLVGS